MFRARNNQSTLEETDSSVGRLWQGLASNAKLLQDSCYSLSKRFDNVLASYTASRGDESSGAGSSRALVDSNPNALYA